MSRDPLAQMKLTMRNIRWDMMMPEIRTQRKSLKVSGSNDYARKELNWPPAYLSWREGKVRAL